MLLLLNLFCATDMCCVNHAIKMKFIGIVQCAVLINNFILLFILLFSQYFHTADLLLYTYCFLKWTLKLLKIEFFK